MPVLARRSTPSAMTRRTHSSPLLCSTPFAPALPPAVGHSGRGVHLPPPLTTPVAASTPLAGPPTPGAMADGSSSPPSVSLAFPRPQPVVSGLGLSGSTGSNHAVSFDGASQQVAGPSAAQVDGF